MILNSKNQKILLNKNLSCLKETNELKIIYYIEKINKKKQSEILKNLYTKKIKNIKENFHKTNFSNKEINIFKTKKLKTNRCTNPLNPKYNFPKIKHINKKIPKFLKDPLEINDIKGTRSKFKIKKLNNSSKEKIFLKKKKTYYNKQDFILKTDDLEIKNKKKFYSTNPLDPEYKINKNLIIGKIFKNKPKKFFTQKKFPLEKIKKEKNFQKNKKRIFRSLDVSDINRKDFFKKKKSFNLKKIFLFKKKFSIGEENQKNGEFKFRKERSWKKNKVYRQNLNSDIFFLKKKKKKFSKAKNYFKNKIIY